MMLLPNGFPPGQGMENLMDHLEWNHLCGQRVLAGEMHPLVCLFLSLAILCSIWSLDHVIPPDIHMAWLDSSEIRAGQ